MSLSIIHDSTDPFEVGMVQRIQEAWEIAGLSSQDGNKLFYEFRLDEDLQVLKLYQKSKPLMKK